MLAERCPEIAVDPRLLLLAIPSLLVLGLLVFHSWRSLPAGRAAAFWSAAAFYGIARGAALHWVTEQGLRASFPYRIHRPLLEALGVSLQEVAGWMTVTYLGWWLGTRFAETAESKGRLFLQVAWGCLFLGSVSWAVESAAIAAGWWHWTVPLAGGLLGNVPLIGLVDWFFVGTDFLLPFVAISAPSLRQRPARFLSLLLFPVHFGAHLFVEPISPSVPIPIFHLVHWLLLALVLWLAARSRIVDRAFVDRQGMVGWLPLAGLAIVLVDAAAVEIWASRSLRLLPSVVPAAVVACRSLLPKWGNRAGLLLGLGALWRAPLLVAALPSAAAGLLGWARRPRWAAPVLSAAVLLGAFGVHSWSAHRDAELIRRLEQALAARDRGDLATAESELAAAKREFSGSHVAPALLAEIYYKTNRSAAARSEYLAAISIKQDFLAGYRHLAAIDLQRGKPISAADFARRGLDVEPGDLELRYLEDRASGRSPTHLWDEAGDPAHLESLAALAYEVGDAAGALEALERGIARWPGHRAFTMAQDRLRVGNR